MDFLGLSKLHGWLNIRRFWCNAIAALVAITIFAPLTFWTIDRTPAFTLSNGKTIPSTIKPEGTFQTQWDLKVLTRPVDGTVSMRIVDAENNITYIVSQKSYIGEHAEEIGKTYTVVGRERIMPSSVSCGPAKIYSENRFYGNPIRKYFWPVEVDHPPILTNISCVDPHKGDQGEQGIQGIQGEKGEQGIQGIPGLPGRNN